MYFQETSARYRAMEPISGSNVIPRRARPGLAGLGPHRQPLGIATPLSQREYGMGVVWRGCEGGLMCRCWLERSSPHPEYKGGGYGTQEYASLTLSRSKGS